MIEVKLRLFGTLRKYESKCESLHFREPATSKSVKEAFAALLQEAVPGFSDHQLIEDSAIADETQVLSIDQIVTNSCTLLILPPVCGG